MKLLLVGISPERWRSPDMALAVEQARDAARRIRKQVDVRRERARLTRLFERIEQMALEQADSRRLSMEGAEAEKLLALFPTDGRARLPFLGPERIQVAKKVMLHQFSGRLSITGGLMAIVDPFAGSAADSRRPAARETTSGAAPPPVTIPPRDLWACEVEPDALPDDVLRRTHAQIRRAIEEQAPLGWVDVEDVETVSRTAAGLPRHEAFTNAIREYIWLSRPPQRLEKVRVRKRIPDQEAMAKRASTWWYRLLAEWFPGLAPRGTIWREIQVLEDRCVDVPIWATPVRITFRDGSVSEPFPLLALLPIPRPTGLPVIRAALMSARHFKLDREVDICIIRNAEVSRQKDLRIAEQEQLACDRMQAFLRGCLQRMPGVEVHLYHTGLEPAVIGAYRAVIRALLDPNVRGKLVVVPTIFRGDRYDHLKAWY